MNKILSGLLLAGLLGVGAQADIVRVEAGVGMWQQDLTGTITNSGITVTEDTLGLDTEEQVYAWAFVKHPVPVLPNLRLEYADVDFQGVVAGSNNQVSLKQLDAILYYNILDNTFWTTVDIGLDVKQVDATFRSDAIGLNENENLVLPAAYGRLRVEIPGTDIGLEGIAKYIKYKDTGLSDAEIKIDYTLVDILPVDVGLELGYRVQSIDIDASDFSGLSTSADVDVDGVYFGATVRF